MADTLLLKKLVYFLEERARFCVIVCRWIIDCFVICWWWYSVYCWWLLCII